MNDVLVSECEAFGRWLGREGGAARNGVSALIKDPRELPRPFGHVKTQGEVCSLEEGPTQPYWLSDYRLPVSKL